MKIDMSPEALGKRLEKVSQLRDLCLSLKKAGRLAGLYSEKISKNKDDIVKSNE